MGDNTEESDMEEEDCEDDRIGDGGEDDPYSTTIL